MLQDFEQLLISKLAPAGSQLTEGDGQELIAQAMPVILDRSVTKLLTEATEEKAEEISSLLIDADLDTIIERLAQLPEFAAIFRAEVDTYAAELADKLA